MPLLVALTHGGQDLSGIAQGLFFKNGGQGRACVFRIHIDVAGDHRLLGQKRAAQIELAADVPVETIFEVLRDDLSEDELLAEVLGSHADAGFMAAGDSKKKRGYRRMSLHLVNLFSSQPSAPSAARARRAAGIAPARICPLSTEAIPRKMKTPSPPAPIAAAIVAVPTVVTAAMRRPAMMVGAASGSSTMRRICPRVIPMASAESRTIGSTPRMPVTVLRRIGRSAYKTSAMIAVCCPMPPTKGIGIRKPNSARLG